MPLQIERRIFDVDEYHRMADAGILSEDDRVELIEGEIIMMSPIGRRHAAEVNRLTARFHQWLGQAAMVSVQNPIKLDDHSEPQPDIALLKPCADFYEHSNLEIDDILLIIEVADSSLDFDRKVKIPLYAGKGIEEAWIVNLPEDVIEIYADARNGKYEKFRTAHRGEILTPLRIPSLSIPVKDILG